MTDITITESHKSKAKQLLFLRLKLDPYSFYNLAELDEGASTLTLYMPGAVSRLLGLRFMTSSA